MTFNVRDLGAPEVSIDAKIAFLSRPESYPERPTHVDIVETHMSWVFLTDDYAYKLKKAVHREFLDFSTVELRRRNSEQEVALNRRLAPNVYLGTVAITVAPSGQLRLGGESPAADWLVKMRRLPAERFLDRAIARGVASDSELHAAALLLADFYHSSPAVPMKHEEYRRRLREKVRNNHTELSRPRYALPRSQIDNIADFQYLFLDNHAALVDARTSQQRIIEAHGDLRPEHIFLGPPPVIIDCLEFNRELRIQDPADELAFLAMECERLNAPDVGDLFFAAHCRRNNDAPPSALVSFYKSCWACFRSKVAVWHIIDPSVRDTAKWAAAAQEYLDLAERYARHP